MLSTARGWIFATRHKSYRLGRPPPLKDPRQCFLNSRFHTLGLNDHILCAVQQLGIDPVDSATPEQRRAINAGLIGRHVAVFTGTGSGKTLSYLLPLVSRLKADEKMFPNHDKNTDSAAVKLQQRFQPEPFRPRGVILAPSRELCAQITGVAKVFAHNCKLRVVGMDGSQRTRQQKKALESGVDLVIATPGRLQKHRENGDLFLSRVLCLVLDEADALVDTDFGDDAANIVKSLAARDLSVKRSVRRGKGAQKCLFTVASATSSERLEALMRAHMPNVLRVVESEARSSASKASAKNSNLGFENPRNIPDGLTEAFVKAPRLGKYNVLLDVLQKSRSNPNSTSDQSAEPSLVFCNSVKSCRAAEHFLANSGFNTCGYHSNMPADLRRSSFALFRDKRVDIMVCTDMAARGLDLRHVCHVVNLDVPQTRQWYLHRAGRTARAGDKGRVTTIFTANDSDLVRTLRESWHKRTKHDADIVLGFSANSNRGLMKGVSHRWKKSDHKRQKNRARNKRGGRKGNGRALVYSNR